MNFHSVVCSSGVLVPVEVGRRRGHGGNTREQLL